MDRDLAVRIEKNRAAASRWGRIVGEPSTGKVYRHVFTHFKLDITPLIVAVESGARIGAPTHAWHGRAEFAELALPTAVRRVLDQSLRLFGA